MAELVALALEGGPNFVRALRLVWEQGDAAFPLDLRLPHAEATRVMSIMAPGAVIESDGSRRSLEGGRPIAPGDALVIATSGTMGQPKGVVHTHEAIAASAAATSKALGVDPSQDRWLACLPLSHVGGLSVVTRALLTETPLDVHPRFDPAATMAAAAAGTTLVSLVTRALVQIDPGQFRKVILGGAAPPSDRPTNAIATYGMTETGSGVVYDGWPLDGVDVRADASGEIQLRCPMLLRCYRDGTNPTTVDGWFRTGDLGLVRESGQIEIFGRQDEVIKTGGEMVWPARIEPLLRQLPGIEDAAVVGLPHNEWGHELAALLVQEDPSSTKPRLKEIQETVRAELPVWYVPRLIQFVPQLPKTSLGKVRRHQLLTLIET